MERKSRVHQCLCRNLSTHAFSYLHGIANQLISSSYLEAFRSKHMVLYINHDVIFIIISLERSP